MSHSPLVKYLCQKCVHEVEIRYGFNTCPNCKTEGYMTGSYTPDQVKVKLTPTPAQEDRRAATGPAMQALNDFGDKKITTYDLMEKHRSTIYHALQGLALVEMGTHKLLPEMATNKIKNAINMGFTGDLNASQIWQIAWEAGDSAVTNWGKK